MVLIIQMGKQKVIVWEQQAEQAGRTFELGLQPKAGGKCHSSLLSGCQESSPLKKKSSEGVLARVL